MDHNSLSQTTIIWKALIRGTRNMHTTADPAADAQSIDQRCIGSLAGLVVGMLNEDDITAMAFRTQARHLISQGQQPQEPQQ